MMFKKRNTSVPSLRFSRKMGIPHKQVQTRGFTSAIFHSGRGTPKELLRSVSSVDISTGMSSLALLSEDNSSGFFLFQMSDFSLTPAGLKYLFLSSPRQCGSKAWLTETKILKVCQRLWNVFLFKEFMDWMINLECACVGVGVGECGEPRQRERRILSRLRAEHRAPHGTWFQDSKNMTWAEIRSPTLSQLSHPGTLAVD